MFYLYFVLQYFLLILLSPIRWLINLTARFLWDDFNFDLSKFIKVDPKEIIEFAEKTEEKLLNSIDEIGKHGDGCKFVGMWRAVSDKEEVDNLFKSYVKDGLFLRKPKNPALEEKGNYSGDMWAGYVYGLTNMYLKGELQKDKEYVKELKKAIDKALFNKPYLQFKSHYKKIDRGFLFRWFFSNAGHFLPILSMTEIAYKITGKLKYKILYLLIFPLAFFDIVINPTFAIRKGKYRYMQWYYVHSCFIKYWSLYQLTKNPVYKYSMNFIYKRFWFNPDFAKLMKKKFITYVWASDYTKQSITEHNKINALFKKQKVKNIKNILRRKPADYEEYTEIIPPRFRRNDYQWEKPLNEAEFNNSHVSGVEFLHISNSDKTLTS